MHCNALNQPYRITIFKRKVLVAHQIQVIEISKLSFIQ